MIQEAPFSTEDIFLGGRCPFLTWYGLELRLASFK